MSGRFTPAWKSNVHDVLDVGERVSIQVERLAHSLGVGTIRSFDGCLVIELEESELIKSAFEKSQPILIGYGCAKQHMLFQIGGRVKEIRGNLLSVTDLLKPVKSPRRHHVRADLIWKFRVHRRGMSETLSSINVSGGGALLSLKESWSEEVNEEIELEFVVPGEGKLNTKGRVVRFPSTGVRGSCVAVQFLELDERQETRIQLEALRHAGRRQLRVFVDVPLLLNLGHQSYTGRAINLSGSGILLVPNEDVEVSALTSQALGISIVLDGRKLELIKLEFVRLLRVEKRQEIAFRFGSLDADVRSQLIGFVMKVLHRV